jgi:hypothetical protein
LKPWFATSSAVSFFSRSPPFFFLHFKHLSIHPSRFCCLARTP